MGVGNKIKEKAKEKGMTLRGLAEKAGVSYNTLYSITKRDSDRISTEIIQRIAEALSVDVGELLPTISATMSARDELHARVKASKPQPADPDMTGKTETYQPWTKEDEMILRAGGFQAVAEFNFLSDADKAEALKDINKFVEFTLSKYKQQDRAEPRQEGAETPPQPLPRESEGRDTTPAEKPTEGPGNGE